MCETCVITDYTIRAAIAKYSIFTNTISLALPPRFSSLSLLESGIRVLLMREKLNNFLKSTLLLAFASN